MSWYLKLAEKAYMKAVWLIRNNPDIRRNLIDKRNIPYKVHNRFYVNVYLNDNDWHIFVVVNKQGKVAGYVDVKLGGKRKRKTMEIGFKILPEYQGIGIGKFALNELLKLKTEEYPDHKMILTVFKSNYLAYEFYKKHGFYPINTEFIDTDEKWKDELVTMEYGEKKDRAFKA